MKLKMVIADDEYNVRQGLKDVVPWDETNIEIVGLAANGQEAYELCKEWKPDILLTDIRMPMIDGLEAASKIKKLLPYIRIVIISGAQDFDYVKAALNLEADGYILKPVKMQELTDTFSKVVDSIQAMRSREQQMERLETNLKESMPALQEKFLIDLITGNFKSEEEVGNKLNFFQLPMQIHQPWKIVLFQIDEYDKAVQRYDEKFRHLLSFSIMNIIEEIVAHGKAGVTLMVKENEYIVIFSGLSLTEQQILDCSQEIIRCMNLYLKISISAGVGNNVQSLLRLHFSYQEAQSAIEYKFFTGKSSVIQISDFNSNPVELDFRALYDDQLKLINYVKIGDQEGLHVKINDIFNSFRSNYNIPVGYVQSFCVEIISLASKAFLELGEHDQRAVIDLPAIINEIYLKQDAYELHKTLTEFLDKLTTYILQKHANKSNSMIKKIKAIIETRYMENLSVSKISDEIFLSPNYISLIFKKETGENITEYITKVRIEAAKQLLLDADLKILEVAEMVGYENPAYFSTVFKKQTGFYPQKFRSLHLKD